MYTLFVLGTRACRKNAPVAYGDGNDEEEGYWLLLTARCSQPQLMGYFQMQMRARHWSQHRNSWLSKVCRAKVTIATAVLQWLSSCDFRVIYRLGFGNTRFRMKKILRITTLHENADINVSFCEYSDLLSGSSRSGSPIHAKKIWVGGPVIRR